MTPPRFPSLSSLVPSLLAVALGAPAWGQAPRALPVDTPVTSVHLDLGSGELLRDLPGTGEALVPSCFQNAAFSGSYAIPFAGTEWVDWGVKACGLTGVACELVVGYGTTALDPTAGGPGASLLVTLYDGTLGACDAKVPLASYAVSGLPGSLDGSATAAYSLTIDIGAGGFIAPDGPIGWGFAHSDGLTGPLLVDAPDAGAGTSDSFDLYSPAPASSGSCLGTFSFGTPGIGSFWVEIGEDDGSSGPGSQAVNPGSGCNLGVLSPSAAPPTIGTPWTPAITSDAVGVPVIEFLGVSSSSLPAFGCIPEIGEILISVTAPNPLVLLTQSAGAGPFQLPVPAACGLLGLSSSAQAGQLDLNGGFGLTNGLDIVFGI